VHQGLSVVKANGCHVSDRPVGTPSW
jgi:hypothetical protein